MSNSYISPQHILREVSRNDTDKLSLFKSLLANVLQNQFTLVVNYRASTFLIDICNFLSINLSDDMEVFCVVYSELEKELYQKVNSIVYNSTVRFELFSNIKKCNEQSNRLIILPDAQSQTHDLTHHLSFFKYPSCKMLMVATRASRKLRDLIFAQNGFSTEIKSSNDKFGFSRLLYDYTKAATIKEFTSLNQRSTITNDKFSDMTIEKMIKEVFPTLHFDITRSELAASVTYCTENCLDWNYTDSRSKEIKMISNALITFGHIPNKLCVFVSHADSINKIKISSDYDTHKVLKLTDRNETINLIDSMIENDKFILFVVSNLSKYITWYDFGIEHVIDSMIEESIITRDFISISESLSRLSLANNKSFGSIKRLVSMKTYFSSKPVSDENIFGESFKSKALYLLRKMEGCDKINSIIISALASCDLEKMFLIPDTGYNFENEQTKAQNKRMFLGLSDMHTFINVWNKVVHENGIRENFRAWCAKHKIDYSVLKNAFVLVHELFEDFGVKVDKFFVELEINNVIIETYRCIKNKMGKYVCNYIELNGDKVLRNDKGVIYYLPSDNEATNKLRENEELNDVIVLNYDIAQVATCTLTVK